VLLQQQRYVCLQGKVNRSNTIRSIYYSFLTSSPAKFSCIACVVEHPVIERRLIRMIAYHLLGSSSGDKFSQNFSDMACTRRKHILLSLRHLYLRWRIINYMEKSSKREVTNPALFKVSPSRPGLRACYHKQSSPRSFLQVRHNTCTCEKFNF
jgi:hypothetical protein